MDKVNANDTVAETESFRKSLRKNKALARPYPRIRDTIDEQDTVGVVADLRSRQASYRRP